MKYVIWVHYLEGWKVSKFSVEEINRLKRGQKEGWCEKIVDIVESIDECAHCNRSWKEVELFSMPCCHNLVCFDYCLYEEPEYCPVCERKIKCVFWEQGYEHHNSPIVLV